MEPVFKSPKNKETRNLFTTRELTQEIVPGTAANVAGKAASAVGNVANSVGEKLTKTDANETPEESESVPALASDELSDEERAFLETLELEADCRDEKSGKFDWGKIAEIFKSRQKAEPVEPAPEADGLTEPLLLTEDWSKIWANAMVLAPMLDALKKCGVKPELWRNGKKCWSRHIALTHF